MGSGVDVEAAQEMLERLDGLSDALSRLEAEGRERWPRLRLASGQLSRVLMEQLKVMAQRGEEPMSWLREVHASDLYLAQACVAGVAGAIEAFEAEYRAELTRLTGRYQGPKMSRDDLLQSLREVLFVGKGGAAPRLEKYHGQGALGSWLRVTGARLFLDMIRSNQRHHQEKPTDEGGLLDVVEADGDIELDFLKREYRAQFKSAFAVATRQLTSQERNLLRQYFVEGLTVVQIGHLHGFHTSTASRQVNRAREHLLKLTRQELMTRLRLSPDEFDSLMALIRSRVDVSMSRLLRTSGTP